jgi:hypothetical protein
VVFEGSIAYLRFDENFYVDFGQYTISPRDNRRFLLLSAILDILIDSGFGLTKAQDWASALRHASVLLASWENTAGKNLPS